MLARKLLATPPIMVVAFYVFAIAALTLTAMVLPAVRTSAVIGFFAWMCAVIWALALFVVAHKALRMGRGLIGKTFFVTTFVLFAAATIVDMWLGSSIWDTRMAVLMFVSVLCAVISMGFAVSALETFEGGSGWPLTGSMQNTVTAILFLPIGIWFLQKRVERLLLQTE